VAHARLAPAAPRRPRAHSRAGLRGLIGRRDRAATCLAIERSDNRAAPRFHVSITFAIDREHADLASAGATRRRTVPCYGDLVAAVRGRAAELHGALTATFAQLLSELFVGRFGRLDATRFPAELVIRSVAPTVLAAAGNATVHLELDGELAGAH
jgi:hypothetical protein